MIGSGFRANPGEVVKLFWPASRRPMPLGCAAVTTAPPAGGRRAAAAVRSPVITSSTSSGQPAGPPAAPKGRKLRRHGGRLVHGQRVSAGQRRVDDGRILDPRPMPIRVNSSFGTT